MEKCIVCDEAQKHGIHLYTSFICTDCEKAMINTDPTDPTYKYFINQLKVVTESKIMS
ncbi:sigma factor G inhibitor Gin [Bacillus sp. FSL K6-3431]|uniref:sigma factor G inhibitor Gin n=1 Tax=Bacillus sp. FSL K6-3431 TaxID=2921500 RepID=UPI0030FC8E47